MKQHHLTLIFSISISIFDFKISTSEIPVLLTQALRCVIQPITILHYQQGVGYPHFGGMGPLCGTLKCAGKWGYGVPRGTLGRCGNDMSVLVR